MYKKVNLENARYMAQKVLVLPLYEKLEIDKISVIIDIIRG